MGRVGSRAQHPTFAALGMTALCNFSFWNHQLSLGAGSRDPEQGLTVRMMPLRKSRDLITVGQAQKPGREAGVGGRLLAFCIQLEQRTSLSPFPWSLPRLISKKVPKGIRCSTAVGPSPQSQLTVFELDILFAALIPPRLTFMAASTDP